MPPALDRVRVAMRGDSNSGTAAPLRMATFPSMPYLEKRV